MGTYILENLTNPFIYLSLSCKYNIYEFKVATIFRCVIFYLNWTQFFLLDLFLSISYFCYLTYELILKIFA